MSLAVAVAPASAPTAENEAARLRGLLDAGFLAGIGWVEEDTTWRPPRADPLVGYEVCQVTNCETTIGHRRAMCVECTTAWRDSGLSREEFRTIYRRTEAKYRHGEIRCAVQACERPAKNTRKKLCSAHLNQQLTAGTDLVEFLARPDLTPYPHPGVCRVASCRLRCHVKGMCPPHASRAAALRRADRGFDLEEWARTAAPRRDGRQVDMTGLPPLVIVQLLFGLQRRYRAGNITELTRIRMLCSQIREQQVGTLEDLVPRHRNIITLCSTIVTAVGVAVADPDSERRKDVWRLEVFGHGRRTIDFTGISQPWLREVVKYWVSEEMPRRRGKAVGSSVREYVSSTARLSESLRLQRSDLGNTPAALGRADVIAYLNRLGYLVSIDKISPRMRLIDCRAVKRVLNDLRNRGTNLPGDIITVLPAGFTVLAEDLPKESDTDEPGRALPELVLAQICRALPGLEQRSGSSVRVAVELLIDTGRRPDEICQLPWACLDIATNGKTTLIYHDFKGNRAGRRLPIPDATAQVIRDQQRSVQARFPDTPLDTLALLPGPKRNPGGTRRLTDPSLSHAHRAWVDSLPPLLGEGDIEFNKAAVVPYSYRHSFAQRHSDAGVPPDVLRDLMSHQSMRTTGIYYRITGKRMRDAVEKVAAHQFDRRGARVWQQTQAALDDEHTRLRIGQVAVPFGACLEPSNVKAGGQACPFRFRCLGCGHFRTDASYLPELKDYLQTLLCDRERVLAAGELDQWARTEATPSEAEIGQLRSLIHRVEDSMDELSDEERAQITQAATALRRTRQVVDLGLPVIPSFTDQARHRTRA